MDRDIMSRSQATHVAATLCAAASVSMRWWTSKLAGDRQGDAGSPAPDPTSMTRAPATGIASPTTAQLRMWRSHSRGLSGPDQTVGDAGAGDRAAYRMAFGSRAPNTSPATWEVGYPASAGSDGRDDDMAARLDVAPTGARTAGPGTRRNDLCARRRSSGRADLPASLLAGRDRRPSDLDESGPALGAMPRDVEHEPQALAGDRLDRQTGQFLERIEHPVPLGPDEPPRTLPSSGRRSRRPRGHRRCRIDVPVEIR